MKDIDWLMSHYSPDIIYFDLVPPLQYVGAVALRDRFLEWFDGYKRYHQHLHADARLANGHPLDLTRF